MTGTRLLALDYGRRRIGVAVSDATGCIAQGLPTIIYRNQKQALNELIKIINSYTVSKIIVGLPLNLKGQKAHAAKEVEQFIQRLERRIEIPIETWDERLTSLAAERAMLQMGKSPSKHKHKVDEIAAVILLQSYLDRG